MKTYMKKFALTTLVAASLGFSVNAYADIKVYVKNCADFAIGIETFNGKDSTWLVNYDYKTLDIGSGKSLKCKGQGKGKCKVNTTCGPNDGEIKTSVKKNKWIKITGCNSYENKNSDTEPSCN